jgi:hypothetical protein
MKERPMTLKKTCRNCAWCKPVGFVGWQCEAMIPFGQEPIPVRDRYTDYGASECCHWSPLDRRWAREDTGEPLND